MTFSTSVTYCHIFISLWLAPKAISAFTLLYTIFHLCDNILTTWCDVKVSLNLNWPVPVLGLIFLLLRLKFSCSPWFLKPYLIGALLSLPDQNETNQLCTVKACTVCVHAHDSIWQTVHKDSPCYCNSVQPIVCAIFILNCVFKISFLVGWWILDGRVT